MGILYILGMTVISVIFDIVQKKIVEFGGGIVIAGLYVVLYSIGYCLLKYCFGVGISSWTMNLMCCVMYFIVAPIIVDVIVKSRYRK
jgi:biotin transporter BioY